MSWQDKYNEVGSRRGFTLVELLVVIGIISILVAMLLPALNKAREQAKAVACASQQRQIAMAMLMYAQENQGWFPTVLRDTPNAFVLWHQNSEYQSDAKNTPFKHYLKNGAVLMCPASSDVFRTNPVYSDPAYLVGTYRILAGHASRDFGWNGWQLYADWWIKYPNGSKPGSTAMVPIPNLNWIGKTVGSHDTRDIWGNPGSDSVQYVHPADQQAIILDAFNPTSSLGWYPAFRPAGWNSMPNNHEGMHGENVTFVDGHTEWRTVKKTSDGQIAPDSQVQPRFQYWHNAVTGPQWACW